MTALLEAPAAPPERVRVTRSWTAALGLVPFLGYMLVFLGGPLIEWQHQQGTDDEVAYPTGEGRAATLGRSVEKFSQGDGGGELLLGRRLGEAADEGERRVSPDDRAEHVGVEAVHDQSRSGAARSRARRRVA